MLPDPFQPQLKIHPSTVIRNIGQLVTVAQNPISGATGVLQIIEHAALAVHNGVITWIGRDDDTGPLFLQDPAENKEGINLVDAQGAVITPGFVDSHTHLVFAGDRAEEFHLRRAGTSYGELLAQGRGILTTMQATREASAETLLELPTKRLNTMRNFGTTTVEVKTAYGFNLATEHPSLHITKNLNPLAQ